MAEVASVVRSIDFYRKLGFEVANSFTPAGAAEPSWAWLRHGGAELMVAQAEGGDPSRRPVLFYLYCEAVEAARSSLETADVPCGPIQFPFYAPKGEFEVRDPDGYVLMITHA
jgi:hypothetical protein